MSPQIVIPTVLGMKNSAPSKMSAAIDDFDVYIGDEAVQRGSSKSLYSLSYPIRHGQIDNWDWMERFWQASIFQHLKCEPEDHLFLLV